jgi:hypothetical protein
LTRWAATRQPDTQGIGSRVGDSFNGKLSFK